MKETKQNRRISQRLKEFGVQVVLRQAQEPILNDRGYRYLGQLTKYKSVKLVQGYHYLTQKGYGIRLAENKKIITNENGIEKYKIPE